MALLPFGVSRVWQRTSDAGHRDLTRFSLMKKNVIDHLSNFE
jgi:hypothetical protein